LLTLPPHLSAATLGPLVELSQPNPLAGCNSGFLPPGTMTLNDAAEPAIAVNPVHPNNMVAAWTGGGFQNVITAVSFAGGQTWEPARTLFEPQPQNFADDPQVFVMPDGALVMLYQFYTAQANKPVLYSIGLLRSSDHGKTWSGPTPAFLTTPVLRPDGSGAAATADPETAQPVADHFSPMYAVDPRNGNLYVAWEEGRFSNFQYNDIAFSM